MKELLGPVKLVAASSLTSEEMQRRLKDLIERSSVKEQEVEKVATKALEKVKKKQQLKVTAALNHDLEQKFIFLKKKFKAKSNAQLLKKLIAYTFQEMENL